MPIIIALDTVSPATMNYSNSSLCFLLFMVAGRFLPVLSFSICVSHSFCLDASTAGCLSAAFPHQTLKENGFNHGAIEDGVTGSTHLNDYDPVDPAPNYETSIKPGPIEHGSPVIPYIPKPSPPDRPKVAGIS